VFFLRASNSLLTHFLVVENIVGKRGATGFKSPLSFPLKKKVSGFFQVILQWWALQKK
jgi:hypothetical protein